MTAPLFITGIGTGIGKTLVSAIVAEATGADYWKPVQAGLSAGTDSQWMATVLGGAVPRIHPEVYSLAMPASPHIAARAEHRSLQLADIVTAAGHIQSACRAAGKPLVIEGAGGLLVPLNDHEFVADLIRQLQARVILVSRNYLGSINHSLLTAEFCRQYKLDVIGWIFNDQYLAYEEEIVQWSGFPAIGTIPFTSSPDKDFVAVQAARLRTALTTLLW